MAAGDAGESGLTGPAHGFLGIVREGRSFSGRERHCCFLNTGTGKFADISSASGFGLADDGRGAALADWDQDGDLDVWLTNRNGPQVRFLRNETSSAQHFLCVKLQGTDCNRDAIGARVRVYLPTDPDRPLMRTLRAGDGFLSQSSKSLHFGLGTESSVDRVEIDWPGGTRQTVSIPRVDQTYTLKQGGAAVPAEPRPTPGVAITPGALPTSPESETASSLCFSLIRLPVKDYVSFDGKRRPILDEGARLVLLNLWASWCAPCVDELQEFKRNDGRLRDLGIGVVALSVDGVIPSSTSSESADIQLMQKLRLPFRSGRAESQQLEKLQLLHDTAFELHTPLPLPVSFLIDRKRRVVAIYKGPVSVEALSRDKSQLAARTTAQWRMACVPFPGFWIMPPRRRHLFSLVDELANRGYFEECADYVEFEREMLTTHPQWPILQRKIQEGLRLKR